MKAGMGRLLGLGPGGEQILMPWMTARWCMPDVLAALRVLKKTAVSLAVATLGCTTSPLFTHWHLQRPACLQPIAHRLVVPAVDVVLGMGGSNHLLAAEVGPDRPISSGSVERG
jgi:hypothetical protein